MTRIGRMKSFAGDLGKAAAGVWARLRGKSIPSPIKSSTQSYGHADPTRVLFPDNADAEGSRGGSAALSALLEQSARAMVRRTDELREQKRNLVARMRDRAEAEVTLSVQALRVVIGLAWLGVSIWLYYNAMRGDAGALPAGMPAADAYVLSRTFFTVSAAALGVALGVAAMVRFFGNGDNRKVRQEAEQLGLAIADTSREFDQALTGFRAAMDRRGDPADAVIDLSRAHLTALEACAYFRHIGFLTGAGEQATHQFKGFLSGVKSNPPPTPVFALGAIVGGILGAGYIYVRFVPKPEILEPAAPLAIAQYPWALNLILAGGALYVFIGLLLSLIGGPIASAAAAKAREEALDALRGGFTAQEAPRPVDVVRRIEDAVDVFRARVGRQQSRSAASDHQANQSAAGNASKFAEDADIPSWRRRDSSMKFVDASFTTAPKEWRVDAFAKKLSADEAPSPASKRGRLGFKKPPRD